MATNWAPDSWQGFEARHLPSYPDAGALDAATASLATHPPLVFAGEARALKADLADVAPHVAQEALEAAGQKNE